MIEKLLKKEMQAQHKPFGLQFLLNNWKLIKATGI